MKLDLFILGQMSYSRRDVLTLITSQQVTVNGKIAQSMALEINPHKDVVKVKGHLLESRISYFYYKFNKPTNVLSTLIDPNGRECLKDYMSALPESVKPVGRLDKDTSGLMLFTNDGSFANDLMHPSKHVRKTYKVTLDKKITKADYGRIINGIMLDDGPAKADSFEMLSEVSGDLVIHEGRNRLIRRMFEALGYTVKKLKRLSIGDVELGELKEGRFKLLTTKEMRALRGEVGKAPL